MSFWGLSQSGKDDQGNLAALPRYGMDAMSAALNQRNSANGLASQYNAPVASYYQNSMQNGFGTPDQIRAWGQAAMPGVDTAMQNINNAYGSVQTPQDTTNQQNTNINASQAYNDSIYNGINQGNTNTFNNAKQLTSDIYGSLIPQTAAAYQSAQSNLQRLMPGGDLLAAESAQSLAPQVAATARSLRMSGIDPNSPEASGQMQAVRAQQGQAMDNILANNMGNYVSQGNQLTLGENDAQNQLGLGRTNAMNNLGIQANGLNSQNSMNQMQSGDALQNQRNQVIQNMRDMGLQDAQIQQQLQTLGLNLSNQQFQTGEQGMGLNLQQQNQAAQGLGGLANQQYNLGLANDNSARAWSGQTGNQSATDLGVEGQNSGWGTKLLAGLAGGALNLVAPGTGSLVSGGITGAAGLPGGGVFGGGSPYGVGGTPSFAIPGLQNWLGSIGGQVPQGGSGYLGSGSYYGGATPTSGQGYTFS